jgi:hypothetical protein
MKPGPKANDSFLGDHFNKKKVGGLSKKVLRAAKLATAETQAVTKRALDKEIEKVEAQIQRLRDKRAELLEKAGYPDEEPQVGASKMLENMWKVFRQSGGMSKLKKAMMNTKTGDREFISMAKEMMKVEAAVSKMKGNGGGQQTVFVVLKGLDPVQRDMEGNPVDLERLERSLDPNASLRQMGTPETT